MLRHNKAPALARRRRCRPRREMSRHPVVPLPAAATVRRGPTRAEIPTREVPVAACRQPPTRPRHRRMPAETAIMLIMTVIPDRLM
jgi:hypothetical protein